MSRAVHLPFSWTAIMAPGSTFSTAKGKDTNRTNTQASTSRFPGSISLKQITISAAENTMQPRMMGSFLPRFLANLFASGYISSDPAMEMAKISTEYVSARPISEVT